MRQGSVAVLALALLGGCGGDGGDDRRATRSPAPGPAATGTAPAASATPSPSPARAVVYLLRGDKVAPVARSIAPTRAVAAAALRELVRGPTAGERAAGLTTAIPPGTRVLGVTVQDATATVDLSGDFASGGSESTGARVAQVVHTLTHFATVQRVGFRMDGEPVRDIGGEGVAVDPPVERADFEDLAPQILIESPLPGDRVGSPLRLRGTANTFEATFQVELLGSDGRKLADRFVTASSGSGTRGTFDATLDFEAPPRGSELELYAYEASAEDGRPLHEVRIPLVAR